MATRKRVRRGLGALLFIVLVAVFSLTYTIVSGDRPLLGLDLQGGVSLVLCPASPSDPTACNKASDPAVSEDTLNQAIKIIRSRVDALGVAEPDISRQGTNVLVQIPGVKDQQRALDLVGQTAALEFRPVLAEYPVSATVSQPSTTDTSADGGSTTSTLGSTDTSQQGLGVTGGLVEGESALGAQTPSTPAPTTTATPTTTGATAATDPNASTPSSVPTSQAVPPLTPADQIKPEATVVIPQVNLKTKQVEAIFQLGPVAVGGTALESATAGLDPAGLQGRRRRHRQVQRCRGPVQPSVGDLPHRPYRGRARQQGPHRTEHQGRELRP
jgi:hypothetical protein